MSESESLTFFIPYHTGYAHAELVHAFSSYSDVRLFIYKWNPAYERMKTYFSAISRIGICDFSVDNLLCELDKEKDRKVVVILTASPNYLFGQLQLRLFRLMQQYFPALIDIYPVGHCMYGCQSCAYAYTHCLPITFTNYIQRKDDQLSLEKNFEILICPSYSFVGTPSSLLSNADIVEYILTLKCAHAIKLHPLAYEYMDNNNHPFLSLTTLEQQHVDKLFQSESLIRNEQLNTLKLIEHARVIICDSNSSIPFETLYFHDRKYIFVYQTADEFDEEDDRQKYFHAFENARQLNDLIEDYLNNRLECKTEDSHKFFLEKYDEPNGNEIEQLVTIRQWLTTDEETNSNQQADIDEIKQEIRNTFMSNLTPMTLYALGDHTTVEVEKIFFSDDSQIFADLQKNVSDL